MKKRIISLALVLIMLFTLIPSIALADETATAAACEAAGGHTEEVIPAVEPTCTKDGSTEGVKCSACGEVLVEPEVVPATGHSYTDKVVKPTYTAGGYTTHTCDVCGHTYKDTKTAKKTLSKPASVTATGNYTTVKLKWNKVSGADGYYVYQATSKNGTYKKVATVSTNSATLKSKTLGKTYYYKIKAYNDVQKSSYSSVVSVKILPKAPVIKTTVNSTSSTIEISWNEISHASGYYVYRKTTDGSWKKVATIKGKAKTSYKDTDVSGVYKYAVVAYKTVDGKTYNSVKSDAIQTRTLKKTSSIKAAQHEDTFKAVVSWKKVTGATKYQLSYKSGSGDWKSVGTTTKLSINKTQTHGVKYQYRVRAVYENDGIITYGPYRTFSDGYMISYSPEYSAAIEPLRDSDTPSGKAYGAVMYISNDGDQKMRIYSKEAVMLYYNSSKETKPKYDRNLSIIDEAALDNGEVKSVKYIDIPAGESRYVIFMMDDSMVDGAPKAYTKNCFFCFNFKYDNLDHIGFTSENLGQYYL